MSGQTVAQHPEGFGAGRATLGLRGERVRRREAVTAGAGDVGEVEEDLGLPRGLTDEPTGHRVAGVGDGPWR